MDFLEILKTLSAGRAEFIIVGGVAARLYGSTRLTHDIDIVPELDEATWPDLIDRIWLTGARPRIPESIDAIKDVSNITSWIRDKGMLALSFRTSDGSAEVDLLVGEAKHFAKLRENARVVQLDGREYRVAGLSDLIAMKRRAGRPQDLLDIEHLEALMGSLDDS